MNRKLAIAASLALLLAAPAGAFDIDRSTVKIRYVELPAVSISGLDYRSLQAEAAHGKVVVQEPVLRTTSSVCVPKGSENKLKDAVQLTTHYYEIPFRIPSGVVVLRDENGEVRYSARIEGVDSYERYGFDNCRYWMPDQLPADFDRDTASVSAGVNKSVREYFHRRAGELIDDALFFDIVTEKVPLYRFRDKKRDYADLNEATELARVGYAAYEETVAGLGAVGRTELEQAAGLWETALTASDLADDKARINRKVTVRLHESLGVAKMVLGDPASAVFHLEKATRLRTVVTSRSDNTGSGNLLERARRQQTQAARNVELPPDVDALMRTTEPFRGLIPVTLLPAAELARLEGDHGTFATANLIEDVEEERANRASAIASGLENRYERMVSHTTSQGFILFLMPFSGKLDSFPREVCDLAHLNQLRIPNHGLDSLPEEIGGLQALKVLDLKGNQLHTLPASIGELERLEKLNLTGNRIETLPDEIGRLGKLKVLQLKGNPLAPGEAARLKKLLPRCKIKL